MKKEKKAKSSNKKTSVIILVIIICIIYSGIIVLIGNIAFDSRFDESIDKQIFFLIMFVIILPVVGTIICKFFTNQRDSMIKLSPKYQNIFTYISVIPAIALTYSILIFLRDNTSGNFNRIVLSIILFSPYLILNIVYRILFIKEPLKNFSWNFLNILDGI